MLDRPKDSPDKVVEKKSQYLMGNQSLYGVHYHGISGSFKFYKHKKQKHVSIFYDIFLAVQWKSTDILEEHDISTFRVNEYAKQEKHAAFFIQVFCITYSSTLSTEAISSS
jgi:hypothetical protein